MDNSTNPDDLQFNIQMDRMSTRGDDMEQQKVLPKKGANYAMNATADS